MRLLWAMVAGLLCAQQPPSAAGDRAARLVYAGQPLRLSTPCTEEDIRALSLTCPAEQPCPVYLELAELERVGQKLFLTGNLHTESATLASIMLASEDDGKSWFEAHERIRSAALDRIQFFDLEAGWAAGYLLHALPRDPFLLITSDGGKSWRRRPLWAESKIGVIEHFYFDSRNHGLLWVDRASAGDAGRYELYESMTGGESWMLRQITDRPSPIKGARVGNPDWRLRADASSNSYLVERRLGAWQVVAGFAIQTGECREPEAPSLQPPEPPESKSAEEPPAPKLPEAPRAPRVPE